MEKEGIIAPVTCTGYRLGQSYGACKIIKYEHRKRGLGHLLYNSQRHIRATTTSTR